VRFVRECGVSTAQAARELDVHVNMLRGWVREQRADAVHAFLGEGTQKPDSAEVTQLKREVTQLKMEPNILKKPWLSLRRSRREVQLHGETAKDLGGPDVV